MFMMVMLMLMIMIMLMLRGMRSGCLGWLKTSQQQISVFRGQNGQHQLMLLRLL
jgi:hypothetical protein